MCHRVQAAATANSEAMAVGSKSGGAEVAQRRNYFASPSRTSRRPNRLLLILVALGGVNQLGWLCDAGRATRLGVRVCSLGDWLGPKVVRLFFFFEGCTGEQAVGQNQWYHFGVGAPPMLIYFSWDWDVHWGYGILTHCHMSSATHAVGTHFSNNEDVLGWLQARVWTANQCPL